MALFGNNEEKELKKIKQKEEKIQYFLKRYDLDEIDERDKENILDMISSNTGLKLMDFGNFLSSNEKDLLQQIVYQQQFERDQNFLIIKQLNRLNKNLEKLIDEQTK